MKHTYQSGLVATATVAAALFGQPAWAADFVTYPDPIHLAKKLPASVAVEDATLADQNTIRMLATKIDPSLVRKSEKELKQIAGQLDSTYYSTTNEFEKAAKLDAIRTAIAQEAAAIDLNKPIRFEFEYDVEKMTPTKFCITAPTTSKYFRYFTNGNWAVSRYKYYTSGTPKFEYFCAANAQEAQKFEEAMASVSGRKADVEVVALPLPAIYSGDWSSPHLYLVPYAVRVINPTTQATLFEIKR